MLRRFVKDWNEAYASLRRSTNLGALHTHKYEECVGRLVLHVCNNDVALAISVLKHPKCEGGWKRGDVVTWLTMQLPVGA